MLVLSKVKMRGNEKIVNRNISNKFWGSIYDIFFIKCVTRKFHVATTTAKKCTKKCAAREKFLTVYLIINFYLK